jgi:hypothetical protein
MAVADSLAGPWSDPQAVGTGDFTTLTDAVEGRYVRFVADFVRGDKRAPEIGPQAYGMMPLLTKFEVTPAVACPECCSNGAATALLMSTPTLA